MKSSLAIIFVHSTFVLTLGEVVDMSYEFKPNVTIYWPGATDFRFENVYRGSGGSNGNTFWYEAEDYGGASHGGTHMDAPSHINTKHEPNLWTIDQIPADHLMGPLRIINVKAKAALNRNYQVTVTDIAEHERAHGRIPQGAIVVMNSGWGTKWPDKISYLGDRYAEKILSFPGFSSEAAEWLSTMREIHGVGVDTPSLDYGPTADFPVHRSLFFRNIYGLENVANVDQAPEAGATVFAFPMKNTGASGGPCRIVAVWGDSRALIIGASCSPTPTFLLSLTTFFASRLVLTLI